MGWMVNSTLSTDLPPVKNPGTHCIGYSVGSRAGLDLWGKTSPQTDRPARSESLYRLLIFYFLMSSTCFEPESSSSGRWLCIQLRYGTFCIECYKQYCGCSVVLTELWVARCYAEVSYNNSELLLLLLSSSSSSPLCRVFILIFLRQTMSLGNTVLQLFCCYYSWCLYR